MKKSDKTNSNIFLTNAMDVRKTKTEPRPYTDARSSQGRAYIMEGNTIFSVVDCMLEYWNPEGRGWDNLEDFEEVLIRPGGCALKAVQKQLHHLAKTLRTSSVGPKRRWGGDDCLVANGPVILLTDEVAIRMQNASIRLDAFFHFPDTDDFIFVFAPVHLSRKELIRRLEHVLVDT